MRIRKIAAVLVAALFVLTSAASPSQAWLGRKAVKVAAGVAAADWAFVAGTAFVETNLALRSAQLGSAAVAGLARLLAAHRILGPRAVYISLAKRVLEDPSLFTRAVQVANMVGLESRLLDERIQKLSEAGTPDPEDPDDCGPAGDDGPYRARRILDELGLRYQGAADASNPHGPNGRGSAVESDTVPPLNKPNVARAASAPSGLVINQVPFDTRGFPIFDKFALADLRVVDRSTFFAPDVTSDDQLRLATQELRKILVEEAGFTGTHLDQVRKGSVGFTGRFTPDQIKAIMNGRAQISDLTWHHHQDPTRMQLVPRELHQSVRHVGGWWMNRCRLKPKGPTQ